MSRDDPPLLAGAIHGVRTWRVEWSDGDARLGAPVYGGEWARGRPTRASCEAAGRAHPGRRAPARSCSCGLYALHPRDEAIADLEQRRSYDDEPFGTVAGIVEAWGRVEVHEDGFRAEYARPKALAAIGTAPGSDEELLIERLAERHGAAVLRLRGMGELIAYCREHGLGLDEGVVRSLLPAPEPPRPEHPVPRPALARAGARSLAVRLGERAVEIALMLVGGLLMLAWYGAWAAIAVVFVIGLVEGWGGEPATSAGELRVVEQALVELDDGLRYVAVVENTSADEAALRVFPRGRLLDRDGAELVRLDRPRELDHRPNLAPGEHGLVVDRIDGARGVDPADVARYEVVVRARREAMPAEAPEQATFSRAEVEGARCALTALVDRGAVERPRVAILARDRGGAIASGGYLRAGPIAAGGGRRVLARGDRPCPQVVDSVEVFASPTVAELLGT